MRTHLLAVSAGEYEPTEAAMTMSGFYSVSRYERDDSL